MTVAPACAASWTAKLPTPPGRAYYQDGFAVGQRKGVGGGHGGDAGQGRGAGGRQVVPLWHVGDGVVPGHGDQLGPAAVALGRVGVRDEAVDLVAHGVADHVRPHLLDDTGVVSPDDDRELMLDHAAQHARGDGVVDGIGRRGLHAHEHLVGCNRRSGKVVAQCRRRAEGVEGEGLHRCASSRTRRPPRRRAAIPARISSAVRSAASAVMSATS
jgi:hypothetical protein